MNNEKNIEQRLIELDKPDTVMSAASDGAMELGSSASDMFTSGSNEVSIFLNQQSKPSRRKVSRKSSQLDHLIYGNEIKFYEEKIAEYTEKLNETDEIIAKIAGGNDNVSLKDEVIRFLKNYFFSEDSVEAKRKEILDRIDSSSIALDEILYSLDFSDFLGGLRGLFIESKNYFVYILPIVKKRISLSAIIIDRRNRIKHFTDKMYRYRAPHDDEELNSYLNFQISIKYEFLNFLHYANNKNRNVGVFRLHQSK